MIRVWILLFVCTGLAYLYDSARVKSLNNGVTVYIDNINSKLVFLLLCIIMVCFSGLRTRMNDTVRYMTSFASKTASWNTIFVVDWALGSNPLFSVYSNILKMIIGDNSQAFIFITSLFVTCSYLQFLRKYSPRFGLSVFTMIAFTIYAFTMAAMKQTISIAIGIWAIQCFLNNKHFKAILLLLIASLFHPYVVSIAICFLLSRDVWKKKTILILLGTVLCVLFINEFFQLLLSFSDAVGEDYSLSYLSEDGVGVTRILSYSVLPFISFFGRKQINLQNNRLYNICINGSIVSACIMLISGFGGAVFTARVPSYFDVFSCITAAIVFETVELTGKRLMRFLFTLFMLVFYYTYYYKYLVLYCNGDWLADIYRHSSLFNLFGG